MKTKLAPFIAIEGMDGSGKTTLIERLRKTLLTVPGPAYHFTREPGGTSAGEAIRNILLDKDLSADADGKTQLLGFFYARAHHLRMIHIWRKNSLSVITDRFDASTFAYQVYAQTIDEHEREELDELFWMLRNNIAYGENAPTLYLYLDLPPKTAHARRDVDRSQEKNHYDTRPLDFYERQRDGYEEFLSEIEDQGGSEVFRIDATQSPDEVYAEANQIIREHTLPFSS